MKDNFSGLNNTQLQAVKAIEGPFLVLAGAGSGKTRVVTMRIVNLIQEGIPPSKILGVTFTNKAAQEMRSRIQQLTEHHVLICTFHSLGVRVLRECISVLDYSPHFVIYDEEDVEKLILSCLNELNISDKKKDVKPFRLLISQAKNALKTLENFEQPTSDSRLEAAFCQVYALYQKKLKEFHAVDFDDLLFLPVKIWKEYPQILARYQNRWSFVLIDEYQDTNAAQYLMTHLLVQKSQNIFVVGDPDQSIYSWRGAHIGNILNFEKDYAGAQVVRLEQNYRSSKNILNVANELIRKNTDRYEKELWSNLEEGEKVKLYVAEDDREESDFVATQIVYHHKEQQIPYQQMVVFYRTNAQSRVFEDCFLSRGIPYVIIGGISFYQRREIKDILSFLRVAHSGSDYMAFVRTINLPKRGWGESSIDKIRHAANLEKLTIFAYCVALVTDQPLQNRCKISAKQKASLEEYVRIIQTLHEMSKYLSIHELVKAAIEQTGYMIYLAEDKETYLERKENLDELITKAIEWEESTSEPTLGAFLEELTLKSTLEEMDEVQDRVNLMTIHNGKGLEFETAFLVGLEEDLFPHINSKDSPFQLEEERRLCYVGITRAKKFLYLSYCRLRYLWGTPRFQTASRFIKEIPRDLLENFKTSKLNQRQRNFIEPSSKIVSIAKLTESNKPAFSVNDWVLHPDFGRGQIQEAYEGSMGLTYKILFSGKQLKTIVAKYAFLSRCTS